MHELAVVLVLNVDNTPAIPATTHRFAIDDHIVLRANDSEGNDVLSIFGGQYTNNPAKRNIVPGLLC